MQTDTSSIAGIDMRQFHAIFFDEADEHLAAMESLLVDIDTSDPGEGMLYAVFRAAHSIKGGASMFGLANVSELAHEAETLLERVRMGEVPLSDAIVDALLESCDVLKVQLAVHQGSGAATPEVTGLFARLRNLCEGKPVHVDLEARFEVIVPGAVGAVPAAPALGLFEASSGSPVPVVTGPIDEEPDGAYGLFTAFDSTPASGGGIAACGPSSGGPTARAPRGIGVPAVAPSNPKARPAKVIETSSIRVAVGQVVETLHAIDAASKKISDIISVIDDIASRTNILAMNALVEAARAGEQGRGLAVVATEVRNLTLRSAGIEQVNHTVAQMVRIPGQNAASVDQAVAAVESMDEQSQELAYAAGTFRVGADRAGS